MSILIIDDSATVRMFMVRALQKTGCQLSLASNGTEGLQKAMLERPHCIILDVVLFISAHTASIRFFQLWGDPSTQALNY